MVRVCVWSIVHIFFQLLACALLISLPFFYIKPHLLAPTIFKIGTAIFPGKKRRVVLGNGLTCSYIELGNLESTSESLLYLHGFTESAESYFRYLFYLNKWHHVVFLTLLNHGDAAQLPHDVDIKDMNDYIESFVQHSGLHARKFHLAGYSLGGCAAIHYSAMHPHRIASLLLFNPYGLHPWEKDSETMKAFNNLSEDLNFDSVEDLQRFLDYAANGTLPLPRWLVSIARPYRNVMCTREGFVLRGVLRRNNLIDKSVLQKLSGIPVMCVQGEIDVVTPKEGVDYLLEHVPGARVDMIEGGSHLMPYTHVKKIVSVMKEWVDNGYHDN